MSQPGNNIGFILNDNPIFVRKIRFPVFFEDFGYFSQENLENAKQAMDVFLSVPEYKTKQEEAIKDLEEKLNLMKIYMKYGV